MNATTETRKTITVTLVVEDEEELLHAGTIANEERARHPDEAIPEAKDADDALMSIIMSALVNDRCGVRVNRIAVHPAAIEETAHAAGE